MDETAPAGSVELAALLSATRPLTPMVYRVGTKETTEEVPGRRDWVRYLDPGFAAASGGRMKVTVMTNTDVKGPESTGWHFHECEMQLNYVLVGTSVIQFEDGSEFRLEPGDFMFIPGGVGHNEAEVSEEFAGLEVCVPAAFGTVVIAEPEVWAARRSS